MKTFKAKAAAIARRITALFPLMLLSIQHSMAQDGNAGINEATTQVKSYFATGTNLMYAIGAVVGLVGAIKVYKKWNDGEHDTGKVASSWFGSCIFLVVVATVLKSFFGV
ncbi:carbamoyl phosphate synthetase [Mucilaginibacter pedocola]|uniref:Carbamoyl phosphate synthetase n=2 Tax=Mucilaginibacter pedocola TaxID=1792845 RepID=A0A1S9P6V0_9SPHI|nr:carbamoyl phosphate synthetase [Mucilaginibacter pedocola]